MFDFHEKRKIRRWLYSWYAIGFILCIALFIGHGAWERFVVEREMLEKRTEVERELREQEERRAVIEEKVEHLQEDRGIEEEIRNRFDVAKEGEQVVIIVGDEEVGTETAPQEEPQKVDSFWSFLPFW